MISDKFLLNSLATDINKFKVPKDFIVSFVFQVEEGFYDIEQYHIIISEIEFQGYHRGPSAHMHHKLVLCCL